MSATNFMPGGCTTPSGPPSNSGTLSKGDGAAGLAALGGLVQAAMNGKLGETLLAMAKQKAIDMAKQAATAALMTVFTVKAAPKPPLPPWAGMGKIAPPGSPAAAAAMAAYNSAHSAPAVPVAGGGSGSSGGTGGAGHPRGASVSKEEWAKYLEDNYPEWWSQIDKKAFEKDPFNPQFNPPEDPDSWFGGNMETGYSALWGLIQLGSPKWPGAGDAATWWVPDKIFGYDMSDYFAKHDATFDRDRDYSDLYDIIKTEVVAFLIGIKAAKDPIQVALQIIYSGATSTVGLSFGLINTLRRLFGLLKK